MVVPLVVRDNLLHGGIHDNMHPSFLDMVGYGRATAVWLVPVQVASCEAVHSGEDDCHADLSPVAKLNALNSSLIYLGIPYVRMNCMALRLS